VVQNIQPIIDMRNPIIKRIDTFLEKRYNLKYAPAKEPPLPKEDPLKKEPFAPSAIIMDWFKTLQSLYRKELDDWKTARETRRHPWNPYTYALQQLYQDSMLDNMLFRQINNRILRVSNKQFLLKDKNAVIDEERSKFIRKRWFRNMVQQAIYSKFFGYSMVYINRWEPGNIISTMKIDREHVIPERGVLLKNYTNYYDGLIYGEYPNFLIYMQLEDDAVGMLERIAPLTILKRHSWASWDEFEQIFGLPLRIAKTANQSQKHMDDLAGWMESMGQSCYAVLQMGDEIDIKENKQPDSFRVFNEKRKAVNEEIAIAVNGQTMTSLPGSSRAQSETHERTQEEITDEDITDIGDWFNTDFIKVMRNLGYDIPEGYYLDIVANSQLSIENRTKTDEAVSRMGFSLDPDYIEKTYNVILDKTAPKKNPLPGGDPASLSFFH